jgi:TPR repeat protein
MAKSKTRWPSTRDDVAVLEMAAAAGDADALVTLAVLYEDGDARDAKGKLLARRDPARSRKYYERAAELGNPAAITVIADGLTKKGRGAKAFAEGERLYRRAFRLGYDTAAENLAATYQNVGRYHDAVRWYRRAEAAGSPTAPLELARAELYGIGTRRNARRAFVRLERLARQRLGWNNWLRIEALQLMADALMNGWLVRRDFSRGESLLQQAAKLDPNEYR